MCFQQSECFLQCGLVAPFPLWNSLWILISTHILNYFQALQKSPTKTSPQQHAFSHWYLRLKMASHSLGLKISQAWAWVGKSHQWPLLLAEIFLEPFGPSSKWVPNALVFQAAANLCLPPPNVGSVHPFCKTPEELSGFPPKPLTSTSTLTEALSKTAFLFPTYIALYQLQFLNTVIPSVYTHCQFYCGAV